MTVLPGLGTEPLALQWTISRETGKVPFVQIYFGGYRVNQELTGGNDQPVCFHHLKASITKCFTA
jgi:hypothetical protein